MFPLSVARIRVCDMRLFAKVLVAAFSVAMLQPAGHTQGVTATGSVAMVSSAHPLATGAGLEILRAGGNAFDAAVAIAAALNVVEPAMSGMGGYRTILVYDAQSKTTTFLNPSGRIPSAVNSDAFRAPTPNYLENRRGAKSVSTPGNVHAWEAMSKRFVPPGGASEDDGHTTHFVVTDRYGNVVSATQTLGGAFGSRIMPKGTGIWLNDSLEFSTFEPKGNPMDAHAGRRKLSGDCPTIVMRGGRPWAALGTPGGHTIGQTVPQIVMNLVDFGMDVYQALDAGRISFAEPDVLLVEDRIPEDVRRALESRGHTLRVTRGIGNAHALTIEYGPNGTVTRFTGAADPRGGGRSSGY